MKKETSSASENKNPIKSQPPFKVAAVKTKEIRSEPSAEAPIVCPIVGGVYRIIEVSKDENWGHLHTGVGWLDLSGCTVIE